MKRLLISCSLMIVAAVCGVTYSFNPVTANAVDGQQGRYVALGDSVAAGAGLPVTGTMPEDQLCARSDQAYPQQVAAATGMYAEHIACSGAKVDEGLYGRQTVGETVLMPQIKQAFALGTPELMTVTVGANDARWAEFVANCYQRNCGTKTESRMITALLMDLRLELHTALAQIKYESYKRGDPTPEVVFTGYFKPFNPTGISCTATRNFTQAEMTWMNTQVERLNKAIRNTVAWYGFASYVPVDFSGHEICSADPWVQSVQDPAPMHPTAGGQQAIGQAIAAKVQ
jgi:lysophospholipase L1-like esterase